LVLRSIIPKPEPFGGQATVSGEVLAFVGSIHRRGSAPIRAGYALSRTLCHTPNVSKPAISKSVITAAATPISNPSGGNGVVTSTTVLSEIAGARATSIPLNDDRSRPAISTTHDIVYLFIEKFHKASFHRNNPGVSEYNPLFMAADAMKPRRGRPKKYGRDSRAVTITLPEDVLASLRQLDADLGRAIVRLVERRRSVGEPAIRPAELSTYGSHAVIVVSPARALKRLPGVQLVPVGNGRALIALDRPLAIPQLELDVRDAVNEIEVSAAERQVLKGLAGILQQARSSRTVSVKERTIIVLESKRRPRQEGSLRISRT
jgi:hypothetical protein